MPSKQQVEAATDAEAAAFGTDEHGRFYAEPPSMVGNSMECHVTAKEVCLRIDNPWAGDTERGFGESGHIELPHDMARALAKHILSLVGEAK